MLENTCDDGVEEEQAFFVRREFLTFGKRTESRFDFGSEFRDLCCSVAEDFAQFVVALFFAYPATKCFDETAGKASRLRIRNSRLITRARHRRRPGS